MIPPFHSKLSIPPADAAKTDSQLSILPIPPLPPLPFTSERTDMTLIISGWLEKKSRR
jgi:hypothetical protein